MTDTKSLKEQFGDIRSFLGEMPELEMMELALERAESIGRPLERRMVNWNHRTLNNCHSRERGNPGFPHAISLKVWFPAFAGMTDEGV